MSNEAVGPSDRIHAGTELWSRSLTVRLLALFALPVCLAVTIYGFWLGDVVDREAVELNAVLGLAPTTSGESPSSNRAYVMVLTMLARIVSSDQLAFVARAVSMLAVAVLLIVLHQSLRRRLGELASALGVVFTTCSLPAIFSVEATPDALIAMSLFVAVVMLTSGSSLKMMLGGGGFTLCSLILVGPGLISSSSDQTAYPDGRLLAVLGAFTSALPWSAASAGLFSPRFWKSASANERSTFRLAAVVFVLGPALAALDPDRWIAASLLIAAGSSLAAAIMLQRLFGANESVPALCVAAGALVVAALGVIRIGLDYHFMERVQAVVVVSLAAAVIAWMLRQRLPEVAVVLPVIAVFTVLKIVYGNAYIPERDQWNSPRPAANAVARHLPKNAVILSDFPLTPAHRYYLGAPVVPVAEWKSVEPNQPVFSLVPFLQSLESVWNCEFTGIYEGPAGVLALIELSPESLKDWVEQQQRLAASSPTRSEAASAEDGAKSRR